MHLHLHLHLKIKQEFTFILPAFSMKTNEISFRPFFSAYPHALASLLWLSPHYPDLEIWPFQSISLCDPLSVFGHQVCFLTELQVLVHVAPNHYNYQRNRSISGLSAQRYLCLHYLKIAYKNKNCDKDRHLQQFD